MHNANFHWQKNKYNLFMIKLFCKRKQNSVETVARNNHDRQKEETKENEWLW